MDHSFKTFTSLLLGAAALASLVTGCVREPIPVNPTYNTETNSVLTKLVLNIDTNRKTKMSAENVQAEGSEFLGMEAVHLLTYDLPYWPTYPGAPKEGSSAASDGSNVGHFFFTPYFGSASIEASEDYDMGRLFDRNAISTDNQSRTLEVALPLGTNSLVIYGKALNTGGPELQGAVTTTGNVTNLASISFGLMPRLSATNKAKFYAGAFVLENILTSLVIAGRVKEASYWAFPTGEADKRYMVYWPIDGAPEITLNAAGEPLDPTKTDGTVLTDNTPVNYNSKEYVFHMGECSWKLLGRMYDYYADNDAATNPKTLATNWGAPNLDMSALGRTMGEAYSRLVDVRRQLTDDHGTAETSDDEYLQELRAGSAPAILRTVRDLATIVSKCATSSPTRWEECVVKLVAIEVLDRIKLYFEYDGNGQLYYKKASDIVAVLDEYMSAERKGYAVGTETTAGEGEISNWTAVSTYFKVTDSNYLSETITYTAEGFPMNIGLPTGSAYLESETHPSVKNLPDRFLFKEDIPAYGMGGATFNIFDYCYPAELMYYGNSPIRVADVDKTASQFPGSLDDWDDDLIWNPAGTLEKNMWHKFSSVSSTTRSVAMIDHINYGSALFKASVKYETSGAGAVDNYLEDNNHAIHPTEANNKIYVIPGTGYSTNGLKVIGIVIGGQPAAVTWDYTRKPDSDDYSEVAYNTETKKFTGMTFVNDKFEKMIYDKVNKVQITKAGSVDIHTICWDNYDATLAADAQSDVYIALELLNDTGQDFYGEMNMVRNGGTFYLVGKMKLADAIAAARTGEGNSDKYKNLTRSNYHYPPYNPTTGETIHAPRVFMQDYMTTATLTLKKDALQHAYVTVPDLRASQVSLGVSIDVKWETGLDFTVEMGRLE